MIDGSLPARLWARFCALRFVIVGGFNTVAAYLFFALLYRLFGQGWCDAVIQVAVSIFGITLSYVTHRIFTYKSHGVWWREYLRFYVVYGAQLLLSSALFLVFSTWLGFNGYVTQLVLMAVFTFASYWAHKVYSFKEENK